MGLELKEVKKELEELKKLNTTSRTSKFDPVFSPGPYPAPAPFDPVFSPGSAPAPFDPVFSPGPYPAPAPVSGSGVYISGHEYNFKMDACMGVNLGTYFDLKVCGNKKATFYPGGPSGNLSNCGPDTKGTWMGDSLSNYVF